LHAKKSHMSYFVYIIQSDRDSSYYKGFSEIPVARLSQHNSGERSFTSAKTPWRLVHVEEQPSKKDALIREKALKKYSHTQILRLIESSKNIVSRFRQSVG